MTRIALYTTIALLPLCSGCILFGVGPADLQTQISLSEGMALQQELAVSTDGLTIALAGSMADMPFPMKGIGWVDFGVYRIVNTHEGGIDKLDLPGWKHVVHVTNNNGEDVQVLVKERGDTVRGLVFVARDGEELVIARVKGNLNQFFEAAMREHLTTGGWDSFAVEIGGKAKQRAREQAKANGDEKADARPAVTIDIKTTATPAPDADTAAEAAEAAASVESVAVVEVSESP